MRVCAVQERGVDFDGRDVFSGDERQLNDAENCGSGDSEPGGARTTCTVDSADEGWRDGSRQTATRHGESVDLAEDLGRWGGVFEQDECGRVDDDADEAL